MQKLFIFITAILLATAVGLVPTVYYRYLTTGDDFLKVSVPLTTDLKVYQPCKKVKVGTSITSRVNREVEVTVQLSRVDKNNIVTPVQVGRGSIIIHTGQQLYNADLTLPCNLEPGIYFYQGNAHFNVRGYDKNVYYYSGQFNVVVNSPLEIPPNPEQ